MNNFAKTLECLKNGKDEKLSKLASEFSDIRQECLANFDSCYSIRDSHNYGGCSCMGGYLYGIKHLDMKMGECKKFNQAEWQDLQSKNGKIRADFLFLLREAKRVGCSQSKPLNPSWENLVMPEKKRQTLTHEFCTCQTNRCNEIENPSKPDYPVITTEGNSIPGRNNAVNIKAVISISQ